MVKKLKTKAKVVFKQEAEESEESPQEITGKSMSFTANLDDEDHSEASFGEEENQFDANVSDQDFGDDSEGGASMVSGEDCVEVPVEETEDDKLSPEERKKKKRLEKLEKRIANLTKKQAKDGAKRNGKFERQASEIKNKHKRQEVVKLRKMDANEKKKLASLQT